jgi:hypothetical protein
VKCGEDGKEIIRVRSVASGGKGAGELGAKSGDPELDLLSGYALINALRGSCKGKTSLVAARELEHKRDERASSQKRKVRSGKTNC